MGTTRSKLRRTMRTKGRDYQVEGVRFFEKAHGHAVCTDEMGLGKTWQAAAYAALHPEDRPVVVLCPATIKYKWRNEWMTHCGLKSIVLDGEVIPEGEAKKRLRKDIAEARDELSPRAAERRVRHLKERHRRWKLKQRLKLIEVRRRIRKYPIVIVNYDILDGWLEFLKSIDPKLLIIDECHYVSNQSATRTKACRSLSRACRKVLALSGTPISGKPAQFFAVLNMVRPKEFPSYWKFGFEYCAPTRNRWSGGWDFSGASHLDKLRRRLKGIMIRRKRKHVLKEVPLKERVVTPVDITNWSEYAEAERDFLTWLLNKKGKIARDRAARAKALVMMGELKRLAAAGKMKAVKAWVESFLQETDEKLIISAVHREVITKLRGLFPKALVIDGSVSSAAKRGKDGRETSARQEIVEKFQTDPKRRLLIGQLRAAGEGIDLIAASTVLFVELGWTPGSHAQFEDRVARMGQKAKRIVVHYLVGKDTIEEHVLALIQEKDKTVSRVLDGRKAARMQLLSMFMKRARKILRKRGAA